MSSTGFDHQVPKLTIESVAPVSQNQVSSILSSLGIKADQVEVVVEKNASLIAGLRVSYKGQVLDLSLQNKLNQVKES